MGGQVVPDSTWSPFGSSAPGPVCQAMGRGPHGGQHSRSRVTACGSHWGWSSWRILQSGSLGLNLNRMGQTGGGSWGPFSCLYSFPGPLSFERASIDRGLSGFLLWGCLSVAWPATALAFPSGKTWIVVPNLSTCLPTTGHQLGLPLCPCLDSGWCGWCGIPI